MESPSPIPPHSWTKTILSCHPALAAPDTTHLNPCAPPHPISIDPVSATNPQSFCECALWTRVKVVLFSRRLFFFEACQVNRGGTGSCRRCRRVQEPEDLIFIYPLPCVYKNNFIPMNLKIPIKNIKQYLHPFQNHYTEQNISQRVYKIRWSGWRKVDTPSLFCTPHRYHSYDVFLSLIRTSFRLL